MVILSEGLAFDRWDGLWVGSGNLGGMNRRLGRDDRQVNSGLRCSSDAAFSVAEKCQRNPGQSSAYMRFNCPSSSFFQQLIPTTIQNHKHKGVVSYKLQKDRWIGDVE
jgi:hypothetical protein